MTAKEYLRQAYRLDHRINADIAEMERLRDMACSIRSSGTGPHYNSTRVTEAPFARTLEKLWAMEERINAEIDKLIDLKAQIMTVIGSITDPDERMVLQYRYVENMTWEQIGDKLCMDESTIRRRHQKALQHMKLPDNMIIV